MSNKLSKIFNLPKIKNYQEIVISILLLIVVTIILILIDRQFLSDTNTLVLLITFWALVWYSLETRELKIASRIANGLNQEPILTLNYYPSQNYDRQRRETNIDGEFLRKDTRGQRKVASSQVMESAFEDTKPYVLTKLGTQFMHYVMEDVVPQLESK